MTSGVGWLPTWRTGLVRRQTRKTAGKSFTRVGVPLFRDDPGVAVKAGGAGATTKSDGCSVPLSGVEVSDIAVIGLFVRFVVVFGCVSFLLVVDV